MSSEVKNLLHLDPLTTNKRHNTYWASLDFGDYIYFTWVYSLAHLLSDPKKLLVLSGAENKRKLYNRFSLPCKMLYPLSHVMHRSTGT